MIIIGERINSSRKAIAQAVRNRDAAFLKKEMKDQASAGADMIDLNVGTFGEEEPELMSWLLDVAQETVDLPLCIDTPRAEAIDLALKKGNRKIVVNSITAETERLKSHLPLIEEHKPAVIGLCMDDRGLLYDPEVRCGIGLGLMETLLERGVAQEDIYIDPIVQPIACGPEGVKTCLESIRLIRCQAPDIHILCGLRNVSHGLPKRSLIDEAFLPMAMLLGMDTVILNPLDKRMMAVLRAAEALTGQDEHCLEYLSAYRKGKLECQ
jgi:cobalamin-dependent methionine synthase I